MTFQALSGRQILMKMNSSHLIIVGYLSRQLVTFANVFIVDVISAISVTGKITVQKWHAEIGKLPAPEMFWKRGYDAYKKKIVYPPLELKAQLEIVEDSSVLSEFHSYSCWK
jgi:hypothetical protein